MPLTFYKCFKCYRTFDNYEDAVKCEKAHLCPVYVKATAYTIQPYPYSVEVKFNNGEKRIYNAQDLGG